MVMDRKLDAVEVSILQALNRRIVAIPGKIPVGFFWERQVGTAFPYETFWDKSVIR